jgi:tetratricopeptide (TPR) repeat protein
VEFPKGTALLKIAVAYAVAQDRQASRSILHRAREIIYSESDPEGVCTETPTASFIAVTQARGGDIEGALESDAHISYAADKSKVLLEIGIAQEAAGDRVGARTTLQQAEAVAANIAAKCEWSKGGLWSEVLITQANFGGEDTRKKFQQLIEVAARMKYDESKANVLQKLPRIRARSGRYQRALNVAGTIQNAFLKAKALRAIAAAQAGAGDATEALRWAKAQPTSYDRAWALLGIAEGVLTRIQLKNAAAQGLTR